MYWICTSYDKGLKLLLVMNFRVIDMSERFLLDIDTRKKRKTILSDIVRARFINDIYS